MRDSSILSQFGIDPTGFVHYSNSRGRTEFHGPCWSDSCRMDGGNHDRMTVTLGKFRKTELGLYRCRICEHSGKLDDLLDKSNNLDWKSIKKEQAKAAQIAEEEEKEKREELLRWLEEENVSEKLHQRIFDYPEVIEDLAKDGITEREIIKWRIGFSERFRYLIDGQWNTGPAISFPIVWENRVLNIRMRLMDQVQGNKYRPIRAGLGIQFFNAIYPSDRRLFIVEGEKKAIVLHSYGISCIGLYGVEVWKPEWGEWLNKRFDTIYVMFDNEPNPSVLRAATKICHDTGGKTLWVPGKPDDYINEVGNVNLFFEAMKGVHIVPKSNPNDYPARTMDVIPVQANA